MLKLITNQINIPIHEAVEKRRHQRIEKPVIIRFRIRPQEGQKASSGWDMVGVNDLSAGGLFFNSSYNIEIGTILDFKIGFSTSTPPVQCTGIVTRVKKHPHTSIFGVATAFWEIDEEEKDLVKRFVNETLNFHLTAISGV